MTRKLEETFNLPPLGDGAADVDVQQVIEQNKNIIAEVDEAIDKIDAALPTVHDLDTGDKELDELARLAQDKAEDFVLSTGITHSVNDLVDYVFKKLELDRNQYVKTDKKFERAEELHFLKRPKRLKI